MVRRVNQLMKPLIRQGSNIGRAGQRPAQAADGVFDSPRLPGGVRVTEERLGPESMEVVMAGELRAIVKGDRPPAVRGQRDEEVSDRVSGLAWRADGKEPSGGMIMEGENDVAVGAEEHDDLPAPLSGLPAPL